MTEMRQMIVLRKDLNMRKGKMVAQGSHASMAGILTKNGQIRNDDRIRDWLAGPFVKICVSVNSEEELLALHQKALEAGLLTSLIQDAGRTEFNGEPTYTAISIGPDSKENLDPLTGNLPLL